MKVYHQNIKINSIFEFYLKDFKTEFANPYRHFCDNEQFYYILLPVLCLKNRFDIFLVEISPLFL